MKEAFFNMLIGFIKGMLVVLLNNFKIHNTEEVYSNLKLSLSSSFAALSDAAKKTKTKVDDAFCVLVQDAVKEAE